MVDHDKLRELADTLTEDQRRLLREGLAGGSDLDPTTLSASLRSFDTVLMFRMLADDGGSFGAPTERALAEAPPDGGVPDGGTPPDGGLPDGGTPPPKPKPEPPLTRW